MTKIFRLLLLVLMLSSNLVNGQLIIIKLKYENENFILNMTHLLNRGDFSNKFEDVSDYNYKLLSVNSSIIEEDYLVIPGPIPSPYFMLWYGF